MLPDSCCCTDEASITKQLESLQFAFVLPATDILDVLHSILSENRVGDDGARLIAGVLERMPRLEKQILDGSYVV